MLQRGTRRGPPGRRAAAGGGRRALDAAPPEFAGRVVTRVDPGGPSRSPWTGRARPFPPLRVARVILEGMSSVCPACGIAVVPGYVRCPKCHAGLPLGAGHGKRTTADPGGTAVVQRGFPISAVVTAVGCAGASILFGARLSTRSAAPEPAALPAPVEAMAASSASRAAPPLTAPASAPPRPDTAEQDRRAAALQLESTLRRQRLWGRTEI